MLLQEKFLLLKDNIKKKGSAAVAFSGGVDSTFLLKVAHDVLGDKVIAVTATSMSYPERELKEAVKYAGDMGVKHIVISSEELNINGFASNPINRCYYCKKELFTKIKKVAEENNVKYVFDGSNHDDIGDYRPGMQAVRELDIISPLEESNLTKAEIRELSKELGLPTWNKPSFACLSSRFPYGEKITPEKLEMVDKAEQFLMDKGFRQIRVRHHGNVARIEVNENDFDRFSDKKLRNDIYLKLKEIGFTYVALDLKGYRTGSMNESLGK